MEYACVCMFLHVYVCAWTSMHMDTCEDPGLITGILPDFSSTSCFWGRALQSNAELSSIWLGLQVSLLWGSPSSSSKDKLRQAVTHTQHFPGESEFTSSHLSSKYFNHSAISPAQNRIFFTDTAQRFNPVSGHSTTPLFLMATKYSIMWMEHNSFNQPSPDGHLDHFQFLILKTTQSLGLCLCTR